MSAKAVACILAFQLALPISPTSAGASQEKESLQWIGGILIGVDQVQRTVSYRLELGEVTTASVGSDAALRTLAGLKVGQQVKLKCHTAGDGKVIVEDAKKAKNGGKWWLWGIVALLAAGAVWLLLLFNASD